MTEILIGTVGDPGSTDALVLGIALARMMEAVPVVAHVRPEPWQTPDPGTAEPGWDAYLDHAAHDIVTTTYDLRRADLDALGGLTVIGRDRHSGDGLDRLAVERDAAMIVIGSVPGGPEHRIHGGSTSERLLHGGSVPVCLAPRGYAARAPEQIDRIVLAVEPHTPRELVTEMVATSSAYGVDLALVTIVQRATNVYSRRIGTNAEGQVLATLRAEAEGAIAQAREWAGADVPGHVVVGETVTDALATYSWRPGDVLAVGSSRVGPVKRILLGDMTFRIVRGATVPVLIAPRNHT